MSHTHTSKQKTTTGKVVMVQKPSAVGAVIKNTIFLVLCALYLFPVYIIVVNSFKNRAEITANMLALPSSLNFHFYADAMQRMNFLTSLRNSLVLTLVSIAFIIVLTSMTAWMLVRSNNNISKFIFSFLVATMLIPFQTLMMPLMQTMSTIDRNTPFTMFNSLGAMVYMYIGFGASMAVFLFHGFISSIPISLEEAATIDGCTRWGIFWRIVFPMLKPVTVTVMILNVIWIWNDFLLPSLFITAVRTRTIPLSTFSFFGQFTIEWNMAMAGLTLTIIPVVIFYLAAQKYIIKGVAAGAVK